MWMEHGNEGGRVGMRRVADKVRRQAKNTNQRSTDWSIMTSEYIQVSDGVIHS